MVPTAWALRAAGHDVRVAVQPALVDTVRRSGLPVAVVGSDIDIVALQRRRLADRDHDGQRGASTSGADGTQWRGPSQRRISTAIGTFVTVADAIADDLVAHARAWRADLVLYDPMAYAGVLAAAVVGVPAVRHLWGADITFSAGPAGPDLITGVPELPPLLQRFGLPELDVVGAMTLDPCPPSVQVPAPVTRQTMRYIPYNGPGIQPAWATAPPPRPRVCVTWGTTMASYGTASRPFPLRMATAAADLGVDVIVATTAGQRGLLTDEHDNLQVVESVPLHTFLPTCAAVVHQGGGGTTLTALHSGVPQLVLGQLPDHRFHAARIRAAGVGLELDADADVMTIRDTVALLLNDPTYRAAADRVRDELLAQPTPADVVGVLEGLARSGVPATVAATA